MEYELEISKGLADQNEHHEVFLFVCNDLCHAELDVFYPHCFQFSYEMLRVGTCNFKTLFSLTALKLGDLLKIERDLSDVSYSLKETQEVYRSYCSKGGFSGELDKRFEGSNAISTPTRTRTEDLKVE